VKTNGFYLRFSGFARGQSSQIANQVYDRERGKNVKQYGWFNPLGASYEAMMRDKIIAPHVSADELLPSSEPATARP
jgi:hypothetical protein